MCKYTVHKHTNSLIACSSHLCYPLFACGKEVAKDICGVPVRSDVAPYGNQVQLGRWICSVTASARDQPVFYASAWASSPDKRSERITFARMNHYPPNQEDPRYPHQKPPTNQQPSRGASEWGNSSWGGQQSQPQANDPYGLADGYGQYGSPSQRPQPGYGQSSEQGQYGQYGQYGSPSQYNPSQQGWGYGAPTPPSQYGGNGQYGQYGAPSQQSPYMPNAAPPSYGYPVPGQQELDYDYDDAPPRKSRRGIYTILSIFGAVIVIMIACSVLQTRPPAPPTASVAGTWYGRMSLSDSTHTYYTFEAFMDLKQAGAHITGSGKICANTSSAGVKCFPITITGSMSSNEVSMKWQFQSQKSGLFDTNLSGSVAKGNLSLDGGDATEQYTIGVTKGTEQEFIKACQTLPSVALPQS